jgi:hypothetical protein
MIGGRRHLPLHRPAAVAAACQNNWAEAQPVPAPRMAQRASLGLPTLSIPVKRRTSLSV